MNINKTSSFIIAAFMVFAGGAGHRGPQVEAKDPQIAKTGEKWQNVFDQDGWQKLPPEMPEFYTYERIPEAMLPGGRGFSEISEKLQQELIDCDGHCRITRDEKGIRRGIIIPKNCHRSPSMSFPIDKTYLEIFTRHSQTKKKRLPDTVAAGTENPFIYNCSGERISR